MDNHSGLDIPVDPRLALLAALFSLAVVFASSSWLFVAVVAGLAISLLARYEALALFRQRLLWLRWFFLFVIVMHVLLTPGHTLFGVSWLSSDGLLRGGLVSLQVVAALAISLLLARTSSPALIAAAAAAFLKPLNLLGVDSRRFAEQVLLTLHFVPVLREESLAVSSGDSLPDEGGGLNLSIRRVQSLIVALLPRLVARADKMAAEAVSGHHKHPELESLPALWPLSRADWSVISLGLILFVMSRGLS